MTTVIKAENISKKYIISHQKKERYQTFSDSLSHLGRQFKNRIMHPFSTNVETIEQEEFWALKDINFEIKQGDRVGIIGRNGAGKSTLLKILSRITEPTTGKIGIKGRVASLLEVGTGFHPELTGRENVFLNGAILGMTKRDIQTRFDEIVAFAEIEKFLDTPVKRYSSGMYVRLAFAVAAHLEPEILVVDEVLAVGDAQFQKKCLGKMKDVGDEGRTVLFVSHNLAALDVFCTTSLFLKNGNLHFLGKIKDSINKYTEIPSLDTDEKISSLPFDKAVKVLSASIEQDGSYIYVFKREKEILLSIQFEVFETVVGLRVYVEVTDNMGIIIFRNFHDSNNYESLGIEKGLYLAKAKIPPYLLAEKHYVFTFRITIFNQRACTGEIGIPFPVEIVSTRKNVSYLTDVERGLINPYIQWSFENAHEVM